VGPHREIQTIPPAYTLKRRRFPPPLQRGAARTGLSPATLIDAETRRRIANFTLFSGEIILA